MTDTPAAARRPHGFCVRALASGLLTLATILAPAAAAASAETEPPEDPNLDQTLSAELQVVHGERVLDVGHVDMGPKYDDGTWRFLIHDDVAKADANATSVWRYPDETVLRVLDEARLTVPDDPAYEFLGAEPGSTVWVVPQTQNPDVVWLGWNTQDPEVMATIDRGITLSLTGAQGPGVVTVYLQSGSFGEPELLWDSRATEAQPIWVDVNTHTHANWVFTAPGVYLLQLRVDADLVDGSAVSDTQLIRFAVGAGTATDDALATTWEGAVPADTTPSPAAGAGETATGDDASGQGPETGQTPLVPILVAAIVVVAVGLVIGLTVVVVRGNRARRRVLASRAFGAAARATGTDEGDTP